MRIALAHRRCPHRSVIQVLGDETSRAAGKARGSRARGARESGCANTRRHPGDRGRQEGGAYRRRGTRPGGHQGLGGRDPRRGLSEGNRRFGDHPKQPARRRTNPADDARPTHLRARGLLRLSAARQRPVGAAACSGGASDGRCGAPQSRADPRRQATRAVRLQGPRLVGVAQPVRWCRSAGSRPSAASWAI